MFRRLIVAPSVFALPADGGGVDVAWRTPDSRLILSTFTGQDWQSARHLPLETDLQLLGGLARDENGNRYVAAMKDEEATPEDWAAGHRANIVHVLRVPPAGDRTELLADVGLAEFSGKWPVINPVHMGQNGTTNSELVYNGRRGLLALTFGHNNGQPSDIHQTGRCSPWGLTAYQNTTAAASSIAGRSAWRSTARGRFWPRSSIRGSAFPR